MVSWPPLTSYQWLEPTKSRAEKGVPFLDDSARTSNKSDDIPWRCRCRWGNDLGDVFGRPLRHRDCLRLFPLMHFAIDDRLFLDQPGRSCLSVQGPSKFAPV